MRDESEILRRGTYIRKPISKVRALEAIAAAREQLTAQDEKQEQKKRVAKDFENKMNPYDYDLSNFQNTSGGVLPAEHLLILSAEGEDTKNIVLSDQRNFEARTELAYKVSESSNFILFYFY